MSTERLVLIVCFVQNRKGDIKFACTVHVTVTAEEVRKEVHDTNALLRKVLAVMEHKPEDEKELGWSSNPAFVCR